MEKTFFTEVLLPLPIYTSFTYRVPRNMVQEIEVGKRVIVQFGKKKVYSGIIVNIHQQAPQKYEAKYLLSIVDEVPVIFNYQLKFWEWMASYYLCSKGEVLNAALPSGLKISSESIYALHPDYEQAGEELNDKEFLIYEALASGQQLSQIDIQAILDQKTVFSVIRALVEKKVIIEEQELKRKYKPKQVTYYQLNKQYNNEEKIKKTFDQLEKAPKQFELFTLYLQLSGYFSGQAKPIKKKHLKDRLSATDSVFNQLEKKGILEKLALDESRLILENSETSKVYKLSKEQQGAYEEIKSVFENEKVCLLHGVTSSGKTEVYVKLIQEQFEKGNQVLYLLPEIALTTQLIQRLKNFFGDSVGVYHSKFNENERVEVWLELLKKENSRFKLIIGARSSLFLPFYNLGLIIVDEEHESTFKQYDPAPRFNARDSAIVLGQMQKADILLGTATPSFETFKNAKDEKYGLVKLSKRFNNIPLPEIMVSDLTKERKERTMKGVFSSFLLKEMEEVFKENEQVIIFKNRRGFSPFMQCQVCGHVPHCTRCDISLTYHKFANTLNCHYCGYKINVPQTCAACGSKQVRTVGFGTERIEEELQVYFPDKKLARLDLDTTRSRNAYQRVIDDFANGQVDVLIGTQMITKGLDFRNVSLVGIIDADSMISFPDFRAHERAYQLMSQVAGRSGRTHKRGKVIIQTSQPYHFVVQRTIDQKFEEFANQLLRERKQYHYPPYYRIIRITCKHAEKQKVEEFTEKLAIAYKRVFGDRVIGPEWPPVSRIRNRYLKNIMIKLTKSSQISIKKKKIFDIKESFIAENKFPIHGVVIDVDPM